jgi:glycine hydroxymethyltransferase
MTTRGMKEAEMDIVAGFIDRVICNINDEQVVAQVKAEVTAFCRPYTVPGVDIFANIEV